MRIGIAGAGGLGSNVAVNLVRSGVKKLKIVDFDVVDESNLNRQFYFKDQVGQVKVEALRENLLRIEPDLDIEVINEKLDRGNMKDTFHDCEIVVEAFDKKHYKAILIEECMFHKKLIVAGSGIAHYDLEDIETKKIGNRVYVVGDFTTDIEKYKTYSAKVGIVAAMMANIVLEKGGFYDGDA